MSSWASTFPVENFDLGSDVDRCWRVNSHYVSNFSYLIDQRHPPFISVFGTDALE
jgi:hypothetical protein